jgi:PmbA protein
MTEFSDPETLVGDLVARAKKAGAEAADAVAFRSSALHVAWRLGELEDLDRSDSLDLGLRVFVGNRQANVSTTDPSPANLDELVERAIAMARLAPPDEFAGLAAPEDLAGDIPDLELDEPGEPDPQWLIDQARACEDAARANDAITNSEGATAGWGRRHVAMAATNGFAGGHSGTHASIGTAVIAGAGLGMERDYDFTSARFRTDLEAPEEVGRRAAERTVKRLGAEKMPTRTMPVVFEPRVAGSLIGHLTSAITGPSIARGTSFLKDRMGELLFDSAINIVEDPHVHRGLRSKPFDGEGVACHRRHLIEGGRLTTWLLDCRSARQLHLPTTGHASRGASGPPSPGPTNVWLEPGSQTPAELMADIMDGLFVTELIGFGVNQVTGDYSRGASGFRIRNGELAGPVSEITIAGNLKNMFVNMTPADDLKHRYGTDAPTVRIDGMTVAGR